MSKTNNQPFLSIITVSKNNANGLLATSRSILNQNSKLNKVEWIVIDGGFDDASKRFLQTFQSKILFKFISEKDLGIFDAMNKGVMLARGKFIFFLNSGDIFNNNNIFSVILPILASSNNKIVAGKIKMVWQELISISSIKPWVAHQATFVPKEFFKDIQFNNKLNFYGDLNYWKCLKERGRFSINRIELVIAEFKMGGIGNSPLYLIPRTIERIKVGKIHKEGIIIQYIRILHCAFLYFCWKVFGERFYYTFIMNQNHKWKTVSKHK